MEPETASKTAGLIADTLDTKFMNTIYSICKLEKKTPAQAAVNFAMSIGELCAMGKGAVAPNHLDLLEELFVGIVKVGFDLARKNQTTAEEIAAKIKEEFPEHSELVDAIMAKAKQH